MNVGAINVGALELLVVLLALGFTGAMAVGAVLLVVFFARRDAKVARSSHPEQAS